MKITNTALLAAATTAIGLVAATQAFRRPRDTAFLQVREALRHRRRRRQ